jgi:hypothetical protein
MARRGIGKPLARAHHFVCRRAAAHCHQHAFAHAERARNRMGAQMVEHLCIDRPGRTAQRQFAQCAQVRLGKEVAERAAGLLRDIDLARLEPRDQLVGRDVDHLDLGSVEHAVGQGLAHADAGERGDKVVEAFEVLDVECREHVDPGVEHFLHVLPALVMADGGMVARVAASTAGRVAGRRDIGVGQFVDQHQRGVAGEDGVEVHLVEHLPVMVDGAARDDLETGHARLGLGAAMGLDHPDHHVLARLAALGCLAQHLAGLANAGRRPKEDLEAAPAFAFGRERAQQGIGIGTHGIHASLMRPYAPLRRAPD